MINPQEQEGTTTREERVLKYNSYPVVQWFFHENSTWIPYSSSVSAKIEALFQERSNTTANVDDFKFDFQRMISYKQSASKQKQLRRGSWFFQDKKSQWVPYDLNSANVLETIWQKGDFKAPVLISQDPRRFVEFKNGQFTTYKPNKPQSLRLVRRGWEGKVTEVLTETMSIITTTTKNSVVSGPGSPPYSQNLPVGGPPPAQVGMPLPPPQVILQPPPVILGTPIRMASVGPMMTPPPNY
eukprot:TRINITY_DN1164_c0_g1_i3.p1 TRINITY_DN1164_c0_g1~~TRINITY_DN1164_c0_g1_i3.p1  ORF type:complete len:241 (+),score=31.32 TRINITY_DN1164_c0_g1_i3:53-775(+)